MRYGESGELHQLPKTRLLSQKRPDARNVEAPAAAVATGAEVLPRYVKVRSSR
jgi:hypothetical protein